MEVSQNGWKSKPLRGLLKVKWCGYRYLGTDLEWGERQHHSCSCELDMSGPISKGDTSRELKKARGNSRKLAHFPCWSLSRSIWFANFRTQIERSGAREWFVWYLGFFCPTGTWIYVRVKAYARVDDYGRDRCCYEVTKEIVQTCQGLSWWACEMMTRARRMDDEVDSCYWFWIDWKIIEKIIEILKPSPEKVYANLRVNICILWKFQVIGIEKKLK